jgi:hypothetical protein
MEHVSLEKKVPIMFMEVDAKGASEIPCPSWYKLDANVDDVPQPAKQQQFAVKWMHMAGSTSRYWGTGLMRFTITTHYRSIATHYHPLPRITPYYPPISNPYQPFSEILRSIT